MLAAPACSSKSDPSPVARTAESPDPGPAEPRLNRSELHAVPNVQDPIGLRVVYPAPTDLVRASDSSFLFGSVADGKTTVTINGHPVRVWPNGAWLAWIPFPPDTLMHFTHRGTRGPGLVGPGVSRCGGIEARSLEKSARAARGSTRCRCHLKARCGCPGTST